MAEEFCPIIFPGDPIDNELNKLQTKFQLRTIRKRHHMSQKQVSEITSLSVKCISDIESIHNGNPTLASIIKFLDCFGYEINIQRKTVI